MTVYTQARAGGPVFPPLPAVRTVGPDDFLTVDPPAALTNVINGDVWRRRIASAVVVVLPVGGYGLSPYGTGPYGA